MSKFPKSNSLMNKNFEYGDDVVFVNTGSLDLEGKIGKIVGKPIMELSVFYIVDLGMAVSTSRPDSCILICEACIEPV